MELSNHFEEFTRGLVMHFVEGGTVEEARKAITSTGQPREIAEVFPGMIYDATQMASKVLSGETTVDEAVDFWAKNSSADKDEARGLIMVAIETIQHLEKEQAGTDENPAANAKCNLHRRIALDLFEKPDDIELLTTLAIAHDYLDGEEKQHMIDLLEADAGDAGVALALTACDMVDNPKGQWQQAIELMRALSNELKPKPKK
ncbi:MAG: hypothetical protein NE330_16555 [Lentisphaeraceae bacterium]|nr:hypothetical protein [Lentisphaeraceae bacterium]